MSATSSRKRPRPPVEDIRADCPFSVKIVDPIKEKEKQKKKRKLKKPDKPDRMSEGSDKRQKTEDGEKPPKTDGETDGESEPKIFPQLSPFSPTGKFKTHETLDVHFLAEPNKMWLDMTRYNSFVLNTVKYFSEGFVYVANETTIQRQLREQSNERMPVITKSDDDWVARILEVRAMDEHHVYARVYWMYWPDELPHGTHDGKKSIQGRQPYHSRNELIASNHMDIINVVSVTAPATVKQWDVEGSDIEGTLFWRQAFDVRTYELSSIEGICVCKQPENPDKVLVGCSSQTCNVWFHAECLEKEAMVRAYERLGKTKPHIVPSTVKQEQDGDGESVGKRPLSPTEPPAAESAQQSIDVKQDTNGEPIKKQDNEEVKHADDEAPLGVPEDLPVHKNDSDAKPLTSETGPRPRGRPRKRPVETNGNVPSADALFKVTANMEATPSVFEIEDLRPDVVGGVKKWEEPIRCLACHTRIH